MTGKITKKNTAKKISATKIIPTKPDVSKTKRCGQIALSLNSGHIDHIPCGGMKTANEAKKVIEFISKHDVTPSQLSSIITEFDKLPASDKKTLLAYAKDITKINK